MPNKLDEILCYKESQLDAVRAQVKHVNVDILATIAHQNKSFSAALRSPGLSVIAEIKRRSPSKGDFAPITDPKVLADKYIAGGAEVISVLTDDKYFGGQAQDLQALAEHTRDKKTVLLRKDFIIDEAQIIESVLMRANAILLIVAALGDKLETLLSYAKQYNLDALVEVHNRQELDLAINAGAKIIGINNRNLRDFSVDLNTSLELIEHIPSNLIKVSESGITTAEQTKLLVGHGFDAVLIGEGLVTAQDPTALIRQMKHACNTSTD